MAGLMRFNVAKHAPFKNKTLNIVKNSKLA